MCLVFFDRELVISYNSSFGYDVDPVCTVIGNPYTFFMVITLTQKTKNIPFFIEIIHSGNVTSFLVPDTHTAVIHFFVVEEGLT